MRIAIDDLEIRKNFADRIVQLFAASGQVAALDTVQLQDEVGAERLGRGKEPP
jgi:hypothetical protein